jgi:hypothetical protein
MEFIIRSINWRPSKASGGAQPESKGLRTKAADGASFFLRLKAENWGRKRAVAVNPRENKALPRAGEIECSTLSRDGFSLPLPYCSILALSGLDDVHPHQ